VSQGANIFEITGVLGPLGAIIFETLQTAITNSVPNGTIGVKIDQAAMFDSQVKAMYTFHETDHVYPDWLICERELWKR
jgi:hypothetical protein